MGRVENKKSCLEHVPNQVVGEHGSAPEERSVGTPFGTSWCVPDVLPSVPVVTVPPFVCLGIVRFCSVRIVKLLSRTPFLSLKNGKRFLWEVKKT